MHKSLTQAVNAAVKHVTPESRMLARQIDERNRQNVREDYWERGADRLLTAIFAEPGDD